jgi:hypothetical protein
MMAHVILLPILCNLKKIGCHAKIIIIIESKYITTGNFLAQDDVACGHDKIYYSREDNYLPFTNAYMYMY